jgi:hypothetical protein
MFCRVTPVSLVVSPVPQMKESANNDTAMSTVISMHTTRLSTDKLIRKPSILKGSTQVSNILNNHGRNNVLFENNSRDVMSELLHTIPSTRTRDDDSVTHDEPFVNYDVTESTTRQVPSEIESNTWGQYRVSTEVPTQPTGVRSVSNTVVTKQLDLYDIQTSTSQTMSTMLKTVIRDIKGYEPPVDNYTTPNGNISTLEQPIKLAGLMFFGEMISDIFKTKYVPNFITN